MHTPDREPPPDPRPADEAGRLAAVRRYRIQGSAPEATFDRFARIAQRALDAPIGLVTIVGDTYQGFKACYGLDLAGADRAAGFCTHAIAADATLVVPDATLDPRFAGSPLVTGEAGVRFYVGAPLRTTDGHALGTLCVMDTRPRPAPAAGELALLEELAGATMDAIERRLDRLALAEAHQRERRRGASMRARARMLERIARHEDVAEVLAGVARFVDPDAPERVDVFAVRDGRAVRRVTGLGSGGDPDGRAPGPVPPALRPVIEDGRARSGAALAEGDGWPAERASWAENRSGVRWWAVPIAGDGDGRAGAVVRFAEPGDGDDDVETRLQEGAALAGIALRQAELVDRLRHRVFHDALTGLPNRAFLHERLRHEMERARRDGHALGVLMVDLDDFEAVNDAYGHEAGDALLHAVAGRLAWVVRSDETVARLGGDEFVVVVRGVGAARRVAERILVAFATPFEVAGDQRIVRPSIGLAHWPEDGEGTEAILAAADSAMYRAQRSGRHVLRVYGEEAEETR